MQFHISMLRPRAKLNVRLGRYLFPVLMAVSFYGCWLLYRILTVADVVPQAKIIYLIGLVIMPLLMALVLAVLASERMEYDRLSGTYQQRLDVLQARLNAQEDFLHSIANHTPELISLFDKSNHFWFVNHALATSLGMDVNDIIGKSFNRILGPERCRKFESRVADAKNSNQPVEALDQYVDEAGQTHYVHARYEKIMPFSDFEGGVLLREQDVTHLIIERERREKMLRQLISTLVAVVDRRDPYAAGHSARVGQLSRMIAAEMQLNETEIEAAEIAGSLMNFGKVLVSRKILTKTGALTPEELQRVREAILVSAEILSIIDFGGPVVPTLHQVLERYDGTGAPIGLKGEAILPTARIVSVANACVALVSARAHRPGMPFSQAIRILMQDAEKIYDTKVVQALARCVEYNPKKLDWLDAGKQS